MVDMPEWAELQSAAGAALVESLSDDNWRSAVLEFVSVASLSVAPGQGFQLIQLRRSLSTGQREYYQLESEWSKLIGEGRTVEATNRIEYDGAGLRPDAYEVVNRIDGGPELTRVFSN